MKTWTKAGVLALALAGAGFVVNAAADHDQAKIADVGPGKLCSAVEAGGHWRDTINVPDGTTSAGCTGFVKSIAGDRGNVQLGCTFAGGAVSWGSMHGGAPSPNCGW